MSTFKQLSPEGIDYLTTLINEDDAQYCAKQRSITSNKLINLKNNPEHTRLHNLDIEYLLDLIEDDEMESVEQIRLMTKGELEDIKALKDEAARVFALEETEREERRNRRRSAINGVIKLSDIPKIMK